jgi:hypothetical protein
MTALDNAIRVAGSANKLAQPSEFLNGSKSVENKRYVAFIASFQVFKATGVRLMNYVPIYTQIPLMGYLRRGVTMQPSL